MEKKGDEAERIPSLWLDLCDANHASIAGMDSCSSQAFVPGHWLLLAPKVDGFTVGSFNGEEHPRQLENLVCWIIICKDTTLTKTKY